MSASPRPRRVRPSVHVRPKGYVLVVVLGLLASLTMLVAIQVRQSTAAQSMSVNSADYIAGEAAAQSVLRFCEAAVMQSANRADSVAVTTPGTRGVDPAAWRTAQKWTDAGVDFSGGAPVVFPGVTNYACLFEDASADLVPSPLANDISPEAVAAGGVCATQPGLPPQLCKYRITARVTLQRGRQIHVQSELRFAL